MAKDKTEMTFDNYKKFLLKLQGYGYEFWTHAGFMELSRSAPGHADRRVILLRHDVDLDKEMRAIERLVWIERKLGILSTVFLRLHDPMYNVLGYKESAVIVDMTMAMEHEIGLHCETADMAKAIGDREISILKRDLEVLRAVSRKPVLGVAAHGDISGLDNHRLINNLKLSDYKLEYHAYQQDGGPFSDWYISNYQGNNWKRYVDGVLQESGEFDFMQYADTLDQAGVRKCTFLIHPRPWHDVHYLSG